MKQGYIALNIGERGIVPHKHVVFTGEKNCDCKPGESPVFFSKGVRLFNSVGEMITALNDFRREFPAEKMPGDFFPLFVVSVD